MPRPTSSGARRHSALPRWPSPGPTRVALNRDGIVRVAMAQLNDEGFDGLTMRRLAERLGIKAASLYNHVRDKNELLALMGDAICAEVPDLDVSKPWRQQLETIAIEVRRVLMAHRDGARVLAATPPTGPHRLRLIEQVLRALTAADFPPATVADAAFVMNSYVVGFVLDETLAAPSGVSVKRMREEGRRWFKSLPPDQYPTVVALADELVDAPPERRFVLGLRALLDGFALGLSKKRRAPN